MSSPSGPVAENGIRPLRRAPLHHWAVLAPLILLLFLWLSIVATAAQRAIGPRRIGLDGDFAMFYTASQVLQAHENPYDPVLLSHAELALLRRDDITTSTSPRAMRVGNPPLFFWSLEPVTGIGVPTARWLWSIGMALCAALGGLAALVAAGWTRRILPLIIFLAMPQVLLGYYVGNVSPLMFLGLALGILCSRRYPLLAGVWLSLAWLKPSVMLPLVLLILLFHTNSWRRTVAGFGLASAALSAIQLAALGPQSFVLWAHGLSAYSRDIASQAEMAPLSALYIYWAPATLRTGLQVLLLAVAAGLTAWWWRTHRHVRVTMLDTSWLWFVWFLATPYAHINDVILLTPPILALLGKNGRNMRMPLAALAPYLLFAGVLAAPLHVLVGLEPLELAAIGACLALAAGRPAYRDGPAPAADPPPTLAATTVGIG